MLSVLTQSISNASFGIYFPKFTGTIYELLSAPVSTSRSCSSYVGAAATKSVLVGLIILATASVFVPLHIAHPVWMLRVPGPHGRHVQPVRLHHRHLGRRLREAAADPDADRDAAHLSRRPVLFDRHAAAGVAEVPLLNPSVYLISGFRWSFFEKSEMHFGISLSMTLLFFLVSLAFATWILKTGWRLKA